MSNLPPGVLTSGKLHGSSTANIATTKIISTLPSRVSHGNTDITVRAHQHKEQLGRIVQYTAPVEVWLLISYKRRPSSAFSNSHPWSGVHLFTEDERLKTYKCFFVFRCNFLHLWGQLHPFKMSPDVIKPTHRSHIQALSAEMCHVTDLIAESGSNEHRLLWRF